MVYGQSTDTTIVFPSDAYYGGRSGPFGHLSPYLGEVTNGRDFAVFSAFFLL